LLPALPAICANGWFAARDPFRFGPRSDGSESRERSGIRTADVILRLDVRCNHRVESAAPSESSSTVDSLRRFLHSRDTDVGYRRWM
jgi:hypothetical protein